MDGLLRFGIALGAGFLGASIILPSSNLQQQSKKQKQPYHYFIGPFYNDLKINGVVQTIKVLSDSNIKDGVFINTCGLYDTFGIQSAELLFMSGQDDITQGHDKDHEAQDLVRRRGGNVDITNLVDGVYAVPCGIPIHRFDVDIIPGHVYRRAIVEYEGKTDYSIHDLTANVYENWTSVATEINRWSRPSLKYYNPGEEVWLSSEIDISLFHNFKRCVT